MGYYCNDLTSSWDANAKVYRFPCVIYCCRLLIILALVHLNLTVLKFLEAMEIMCYVRISMKCWDYVCFMSLSR